MTSSFAMTSGSGSTVCFKIRRKCIDLHINMVTWWTCILFLSIGLFSCGANGLQYKSIVPSYSSSNDLVPCEDLFKGFSPPIPCMCNHQISHKESEGPSGYGIICDSTSFFGDFPALPFRANIHTFSQRFAHVHNLEPQLFTASNVPLIRVDFSHNRIRRLMDRIFDGIEGTLQELDLSNNLLGDQLNPIFSTNEFLHLRNLNSLDLSFNQLKALDNNLLKGLRNLTHLNLDGNELSHVPVGSLSGIPSLTILNLGSNLLDSLTPNSFPSNFRSLVSLNISFNQLDKIRDGSFTFLENLQELYIDNNQLSHLSNDIFTGLINLEILDLSNNFLESFPTDALTVCSKLQRINFSSNNILTLEDKAFAPFSSLTSIDLSRNNLKSLTNHEAFFGLNSLKSLNLAYNRLHNVDDMDETLFLPLNQLEVLDLTDNEIRNFPTRILNGLPNLHKLFLDYNLITAINNDSLVTIKNVDELSMAYNMLEQIPEETLASLSNLRLLNLHGNKLDHVTQGTFFGVGDNLLGLDLGFNDLIEIPVLSMPKLMILNLAKNQFTHINVQGDTFNELQSIRFLNLSFNSISFLPEGVFSKNINLETIDLKGNSLEKLDRGIFIKLNISRIDLSFNQLHEVSPSSFEDMKKLKAVDLSNNKINVLKNGAFDAVPNLRSLQLHHNRLTSFKGDFFTSRTRIEDLNLQYNQISYLYPNSFNIHRRLKRVNLSFNKLTFFPTEIITNIRSLEEIDVSWNQITSLESAYFANMPSLKKVSLSHNDIPFIPDGSFSNSTNIHSINLSSNRITTIGSGAFHSIARLHLDISHNHIDSLATELFARTHVFHLIGLDISNNNLTQFPGSSLRKQYSSLETLKMSHNRINILPPNSDVLVNIKDLDVSFNPLTPETLDTFFTEPKSVRKLNVAGTHLPTFNAMIEMPFLRHLNLSSNRVYSLDVRTFGKTSFLHTLDLSNNQLMRLNEPDAITIWKSLPKLKVLHINHNPIQNVLKGDFDFLGNLHTLDMSHLNAMNHFECESLHPLKKLHHLILGQFAHLPDGNLKMTECLEQLNIKSIQRLDLQFTENSLNSHLHKILYYAKLTHLTLRGSSLATISSSAFNGLKQENMDITLVDTSLTELPDNIFADLLVSSKMVFSIAGNQIRSISGQLLTSLDSKLNNVLIKGLAFNPILCDCDNEPLWKWINQRIKTSPNAKYYNSIDSYDDVYCSYPDLLRGKSLESLNQDELRCEMTTNNKTTTTFSSLASSTTTSLVTTQKPSSMTTKKIPNVNSGNRIRLDSEAFEKKMIKQQNSQSRHNTQGQQTGKKIKTLTRMDTMIIGIIAGVIAFLCILVIIICILKLKKSLSSNGSSSNSHQHIMSPNPNGPIGISKTCTCSSVEHPCSSCLTVQQQQMQQQMQQQQQQQQLHSNRSHYNHSGAQSMPARHTPLSVYGQPVTNPKYGLGHTPFIYAESRAQQMQYFNSGQDHHRMGALSVAGSHAPRPMTSLQLQHSPQKKQQYYMYGPDDNFR